MNKKGLAALLVSTSLVFACNMQQTAFDKDLSFLKKYDSVVVLSSGNSKVIVSPRYQAKVFTSTAGDGSSFGWINYDVFTDASHGLRIYVFVPGLGILKLSDNTQKASIELARKFIKCQ